MFSSGETTDDDYKHLGGKEQRNAFIMISHVWVNT
jgi:hypothetical protein